MVEKFGNIDLLLNKITEDKRTKNISQKRFPVRYIFLSNFETLKQLVNRIKEIGIKTFELPQLLPKDDGWITKQEFIDKIKNLDTGDDFLLLPFSEIARFYDKQDFNNLFSQLTELENPKNSHQRIYIPLMGIRDRFEKEFYQNFNRKIEYSFVWEINGNAKRASIFLNNDLSIKVGSFQKIIGTKEWLTLWKKDLSASILCLSKTLFSLSNNAKPDEIFDFKKLNNLKELMNNIYKIDIPIEYKDEEKDFWTKLLEYVNNKEYSYFHELVKNIVNATKIDIKNFIELWLSPNRTIFEKWLIKHYLLSQNCIKEIPGIISNAKNDYLCQVINNVNSYDNIDLLRTLWLHIFDIKLSEGILEHRFALLQQFYSIKSIELPQNSINAYKQKIEQIEDNKIKLQYLTGILDFEKELIIGFFVKKNDITLLEKFPELHKYFEDIEFDNPKEEQSWIYSYIKEYKNSKINNEYTKQIDDAINSINCTEGSFYKWYYSFDEVTKFLDNNFDYIFWIDAIGVEWLNLIIYWLEQQRYNIENKYIARVKLPTTTELNRYNNNNIAYIQDFDKSIHQSIYKYPQTIISEIKELKRIFDKNIRLEKNKRVIIISDHGLSALVRLKESSKNFPRADHEGRYVKLDNPNSFNEDANYIRKDDYIIASKHISLSTKPKREVHGGCTPEEVLVPVIIFNSISDFEKEETYNIDLINKEIDIKNPILSINISPEPIKKVHVTIDKKTKIELIKDKNNFYSKNIGIIKSGRHAVKINIGNFEKEDIINIKSGFKEEILF